MTAQQMWDNVLVTYDALYSALAPGFEVPEANILLTKAQWYYILQRINPKNNRNMEGIEETELRSQGLSALIKDGQQATDPPTTSDVSQVGVLQGEVFWALPQDFMYTLYEAVQTDVPICGTTTYTIIPVVPISHDEYNLNYSNPYRQPWTNGSEGLVWRLVNQPQIVKSVERKIHGLVTLGFNVTQYYIRYFKKPLDIQIGVQDCELDDFTHQAIVDIAVKLLSAAVREQIPVNQLTADMLE
jgi:hypothetical protein